MVKYLNFHNYSFALRYFFNVNGKATQCDTPLVFNTKLVVPDMKVLTPFLHTYWLLVPPLALIGPMILRPFSAWMMNIS
jgi:hypothetical protein